MEIDSDDDWPTECEHCGNMHVPSRVCAGMKRKTVDDDIIFRTYEQSMEIVARFAERRRYRYRNFQTREEQQSMLIPDEAFKIVYQVNNMTRTMPRSLLTNAKYNKNDEFHTQLKDIESELKYYHSRRKKQIPGVLNSGDSNVCKKKP